MADKTYERGGSATFREKWRDLGNATDYAQSVANETLLAGEDQVNERFRVEQKPADGDSIQETLQNAVTSTGTGTAINLKGYKSLLLRVQATSGTWNGGFQVTMDDTNWYYVALIKLSDTSTVAGSATQFNPVAATVDDLYALPDLPFNPSQGRFNIAASTSGTITVTSRKLPR